MTGFARSEGSDAGIAWAWELRSVNGRGLDLRLRLPPGFEALEPVVRGRLQAALKRGNVTANLTVRAEAQPALAPDKMALEQVLALALDLARRIPGAPVPRAEALLALPGVLRPAAAEASDEMRARQAEAVRAGFEAALAQLIGSRAGEGARLGVVLGGLLDEIAALREAAAGQAAGQPQAQRARMMEAVAALLEGQSLPEERIAQEVALLASRSDVREELDRLAAHIEAARALLGEAAAVGRRLDFLVQEFNREANTLCSKSASLVLTDTGLRLKAAIEQLREQVQNLE
jgi:uncharacterized protein (TIGR00255 family)